MEGGWRREKDGEDGKEEEGGRGGWRIKEEEERGKRMENLSRFHLPFIYHRLLFISFSIYSPVPAASACFGSP